MNGETIKLIEEKIEELYNSLMEKPLQVLGIFNNFFGEDNVDMQRYLNLDEFKSWMSTEPVSTYITDNIVSANNNNWSLFKTHTITDLSENLVEQVINAFTNNAVKDRITNAKFSNIFILVHFPHVRVTNENDRFVDINHLWAKIKVMCDGTLNGSFTLNRSEYTMLHINSNYMHSHVNAIPISDFTIFQNPCTGSGPINNTISTLNRSYDEDMWNMFCLELSKYVTVESIEGRPYKFLENLGTNNMETEIDRFTTYLVLSPYFGMPSNDIKEFVRYFVSLKKIKFNFVNDSYSIGMSFIEFITLISNEFIKWYNAQFNKGELTLKFEELKSRSILRECIIDNGKIYYSKGRGNENDPAQYIGRKICVFKGREITVNITNDVEIENKNKSVILNIQAALYILTIILKVLNYRYGRSKAIHKDSQIGTEVVYL